MHSPASISSTCVQKASRVGNPACICTRCVWQGCLECTVLPAFPAHVSRRLSRIGNPACICTRCVCGRNVWNAQSCQHFQHMCPGGFQDWQSCLHLHQMCVAGMSEMHSPASISSTCVQKASRIGSPACICTGCVWQECLECTVLPAFPAHVSRRFPGLAVLPACLRGCTCVPARACLPLPAPACTRLPACPCLPCMRAPACSCLRLPATSCCWRRLPPSAADS